MAIIRRGPAAFIKLTWQSHGLDSEQIYTWSLPDEIHCCSLSLYEKQHSGKLHEWEDERKQATPDIAHCF